MPVTSIADQTAALFAARAARSTVLRCGLAALGLTQGCGWVGRELVLLGSEGPADPGELAVVDPLPSPDTGAGAGHAGVPDAPDEQDAPDAPDVDEPCDFSGTWAAKVDINTTWNRTTAIASGSGVSEVWVKYELNPDGSLVLGSMSMCGVTIPDFELLPLIGDEAYRVDFGIPLFDAEPARALVQVETMGVTGEGFPGDDFTMADAALVLGNKLQNPLTDPWPMASALVDDDTDGDGKPGVTIYNVDDGTYVPMRVEPLGAIRSDRGYYASRVVMSWNGTVTSCGEVTGTASVPRFDTHFVGCGLVGGGDCSAVQHTALDGFRPVHRPAGARFHGVKLEDGATCAMAREALP